MRSVALIFVFFCQLAFSQSAFAGICPEHQYKDFAGKCYDKCLDGAVWNKTIKSCVCLSSDMKLSKKGLFSNSQLGASAQSCVKRCGKLPRTHWDKKTKKCRCPIGTKDATPSIGGMYNLKCIPIKCHKGKWSDKKKKCLRCPKGTKRVSHFCISNSYIGKKVWSKDRKTFECAKGSVYCESLYVCLMRHVRSSYSCSEAHPF